MKFSVMVHTEGDEFIATCESLGITSRGMTPDNALDSMRANIRYNLEYCPCSGVGDDYVQLDVSS